MLLYTLYSCIISLVFKIVQIKEIPKGLIPLVTCIPWKPVQFLFCSFDLWPHLIPHSYLSNNEPWPGGSVG